MHSLQEGNNKQEHEESTYICISTDGGTSINTYNFVGMLSVPRLW